MAPSGTCSKAGTPWTEQYNKVRRIHTEYRALPHGGEKISVIGTQPEEFAAMIADRLQLELRNN